MFEKKKRVSPPLFFLFLLRLSFLYLYTRMEKLRQKFLEFKILSTVIEETNE